MLCFDWFYLCLQFLIPIWIILNLIKRGYLTKNRFAFVTDKERSLLMKKNTVDAHNFIDFQLWVGLLCLNYSRNILKHNWLLQNLILNYLVAYLFWSNWRRLLRSIKNLYRSLALFFKFWVQFEILRKFLIVESTLVRLNTAWVQFW